MKVYYCDEFVLPLPPGHRFPMAKYSRLRDRVVEGGAVVGAELRVPVAATDEELVRVHDPEYVRRVVAGELDAAEVRRIGFPWSPALVERSRRSVGGTIEACRAALEDGAAANLAGGTHHAFADRGEGFCVFNDAAVAARAMQAEGRVTRVVVLDCDVHQGNGTAAIFRGDPTVFTLSIHGANNFPFRKEESDLDLALPDGAGDEAFLEAVDIGVREALARSGADLAIYIAGADPFEGDRLGRLRVSKGALAERDRILFDHCERAGVPVAVVMGGGYAAEVEDTVEIHLHSVAEAARRVVTRRAGAVAGR
jgi:acetoin utilization deacetylase AcuC-like enzyme